MGQVVLHLDKAKGTDSAMSAHIERTITPKNADPNKTHLNKELIEFPEGVNNRHQAIQYRLDNAGLTRKIGTNQVRAIRIMLSGSQNEMKSIESEGKLNQWCNDNLDWLYKTYGKENIVSAVLHMDETTPHIHATLVPIVTGQRRKAKQDEQSTKKKYKKKNTENTRLCADDVMARDKLKEYQDTYAQAMAKYGLQRGIDGSQANHITAQQYNRELTKQNESLQENLEELQTLKEQAGKELLSIKSNIKTDKLKSDMVDMGSNIAGSISSFIGIPKVKKQKQEIELLKTENELIKTEFSKEINSLKNHITIQQKEHEKSISSLKIEYTNVINALKQELQKIHELVPTLKEFLRMENLCRIIGFSKEAVLLLLKKQPVTFSGSLYSPEHDKKFKAENSVAQVVPNETERGKLKLTINEIDFTDWCKQKFSEFKLSVSTNVKTKQGKGIRQ